MARIDKDPVKLPFIYQFISGAVAGMSETIMMYPLDVVKTRFQLQINKKALATSSVAVPKQPEHSSILSCLSKILKEEGFKNLYKGMSPPLLMEVPKRAVKFASNEQFQQIMMKKFKLKEVTSTVTLLAGTFAGITESLIVVPFELVKIRLQDAQSDYRSPIRCTRTIIENQGLFGIYAGFESTIWRNTIWNASYFGLIFQVKKFIPRAKSTTKFQGIRNDFLVGAIAGCMSCFLSVPFDVVKTRMQGSKKTSSGMCYGWAWQSVFLIYRTEGIKGIYKGILPIICRYGPGGGLLLVVFNGVNELFRMSDHYFQTLK
ncbi:hypothetical protein NCAS_0C04400 [Naumovozyma castellii]|uniref:Uncharacterized protein n=1 Tax=Naumovozyma castellii TaxID=27288 RepID=G0VD68_NAUCA|nr:hypothetical protein NCAS_0C04400 [Naumovozyma castellii CBS 4309]CCC69430.1 hypothetical protein NCAS_0C04400 [Naumovozyma castellii CBS 4309]